MCRQGFNAREEGFTEFSHPAEGYAAEDTSNYSESDIARLTEEEQIEMAISNSLKDQGKRGKK